MCTSISPIPSERDRFSEPFKLQGAQLRSAARRSSMTALRYITE